jgi:hypothetical protein
VEASLLPSKAIRALCKQAVVTVIKKEDPGCAELRKEFAIPYLNSWVVVLDGQGETLASWMGDTAGAGCTQRSVGKFPRNLARLIREGLERSETLEELERRWKDHPHDMERFEALAHRLEEMEAHGKLRQLCREAAANPALSDRQRDEFRIREFTARASDPSERLSTRKARARFVREGEELLVELAAHPKAAELIHALFSRAYAHTFDVPGRSARAVARLERASRKVADPTPLKERIRELADMRAQWMAVTNESLQQMEDGFVKNFIGATLGDARAAIKFCSRPPYNEIPEYQEWLREAQKKRERERKRSRVR